MNSLAIPTNEKAHTDNGMDFTTLLAGYQTANENTYQHNIALSNLAYLLGNDKLRFIHDDIVVDGIERPTANAIAIVLYNQHWQSSNLAIYPLDNREPFLLHDFNNDGFIFGNAGELIAVNNLDEAKLLSTYLQARQEAYTVIAPFQVWQFESLVKAHASQNQVMLLTNYEKGREFEKTFHGMNIKVVATVDILEDLIVSHSINEILELPKDEIKIKLLNGIEWGEIEPLHDDNTPATPYPIEAWQGVLGDAVKAIAYHAQVPQALAGQVVLGALSTMIQGKANAPYSDGVKYMPVAIYLLSQYPSGEGKTLANSLAYQCIANHQHKLDGIYKIDLKEWEIQKASTKRAEMEQFLIDNPKPTQKTLFVRSGTLQGILDNMLMNNQKNITWVTADCGQFFGGHSMKLENMLFLISCLSDILEYRRI